MALSNMSHDGCDLIGLPGPIPAKCNKATCCGLRVQSSNPGCGLCKQSSGAWSREARFPLINGWQMRDKRLTAYTLLFFEVTSGRLGCNVCPYIAMLVCMVSRYVAILQTNQTTGRPLPSNGAWVQGRAYMDASTRNWKAVFPKDGNEWKASQLIAPSNFGVLGYQEPKLDNQGSFSSRIVRCHCSMERQGLPAKCSVIMAADNAVLDLMLLQSLLLKPELLHKFATLAIPSAAHRTNPGHE